MHQHDKNSKPNHDILLLLTVKNLKEQSIKKDVEIEQLKESNANKDETLNELKLDFEDLKNQFQQMTNSIEMKEKETKHILNEIIENQTQKSQQLIKDIEDLKTFSETTSRLHYSLSEESLRRNYNYNKILFQAEDGIRDCLLSRGLGDVYKRQKKIFFESSQKKKRK